MQRRGSKGEPGGALGCSGKSEFTYPKGPPCFEDFLAKVHVGQHCLLLREPARDHGNPVLGLPRGAAHPTKPLGH